MGVRLYKHRHGIHITVGNVMLDVSYVAVVDYGFKRTEMLWCTQQLIIEIRNTKYFIKESSIIEH
jgi:hypothetical protein